MPSSPPPPPPPAPAPASRTNKACLSVTSNLSRIEKRYYTRSKTNNENRKKPIAALCPYYAPSKISQIMSLYCVLYCRAHTNSQHFFSDEVDSSPLPNTDSVGTKGILDGINTSGTTRSENVTPKELQHRIPYYLIPCTLLQ